MNFFQTGTPKSMASKNGWCRFNKARLTDYAFGSEYYSSTCKLDPKLNGRCCCGQFGHSKYYNFKSEGL